MMMVRDSAWFPLLSADSGSGDAPAEPGSWPDLAGAILRGARLLVVEDDVFIGMEIEDILRTAGHDVLAIAVSADEAVAAALDARPDLILMDIRLLGPRDGIDAALEIRQRADIPAIFVSAHQDAAVRSRAEAARPLGWVPKPFSPPQLLAALEAALRDLRAGR
jgi:two-component system, response regulator PdtaR